jgi:hypothetical protein
MTVMNRCGARGCRRGGLRARRPESERSRLGICLSLETEAFGRIHHWPIVHFGFRCCDSQASTEQHGRCAQKNNSLHSFSPWGFFYCRKASPAISKHTIFIEKISEFLS